MTGLTTTRSPGGTTAAPTPRAIPAPGSPGVPLEVALTGRAAPRRITFPQLTGVELRKMFDTRSGFWLMASIVIMSVLATAATILFAPDEELTYGAFAGAVGFPMAVILPMIAILSVTSEWSQRTGLSTFTLVPHRGKVIGAKAAAAILVGVVAIPVAAAVGAVGNVVGTAIAGVPQVWDISAVEIGYIVLGNVLGLLAGFMLGVLLRSSAAAIVAYFVYSLMVPGLLEMLAALQEWFRDIHLWVNFNNAQARLFDGGPVGVEWAHLATTTALWLVLPLAVGLVGVLRSEVK